MAHLKQFRQRWLATAAAQLSEAPAAPQLSAAPVQSQQREANGAALLPKKRLLETAGTAARQQHDSGLAGKKPRQVPAAKLDAARGGAVPGRPGPKPKLTSAAKSIGDGKPASKPAFAPAAAAAKSGKREGTTGAGVDAGKVSRAATKDAGKGSIEKAATVHAGLPGKKAAGQGKEEAAVKRNSAPAENLANPKAQGEARPAKPTAPKPLKQEQQQEHAGSNPSSTQQEGASEQRHLQQATSPALILKLGPVGGEAGSNSIVTPVELLLAPAETAQPMGELVVTMYSGHSELWEAVRSRFADRLPSSTKLRLVYQDVDGDWLLLQPEAPWNIFARTVRKLVIAVPPSTMKKA